MERHPHVYAATAVFKASLAALNEKLSLPICFIQFPPTTANSTGRLDPEDAAHVVAKGTSDVARIIVSIVVRRPCMVDVCSPLFNL